MTKLTAKEILELKGKRKIVMTGACDYYTAKAAEKAGIDILGTGGGCVDYLVRGRMTGTKDTLQDAIFVLEGVRSGAPNTFIFTVLPFGYEMLGMDDTLKYCVGLIKGGADAIRIQGGGKRKVEKIKRLTEEYIPCAGHLGLLPLYTTWIGGFRCQGKKAEIAAKIYEEALRVQEAGAIWIEMECVPYKVAAEITKRIKIPIIGMGSGPYCDGEVQVPFDTLGIHDGHYPKHSKKYMDYYNQAVKAFSTFREEVQSNKFPTKDYSFEIEDDEYEMFLEKIAKVKD